MIGSTGSARDTSSPPTRPSTRLSMARRNASPPIAAPVPSICTLSTSVLRTMSGTDTSYSANVSSTSSRCTCDRNLASSSSPNTSRIRPPRPGTDSAAAVSAPMLAARTHLRRSSATNSASRVLCRRAGTCFGLTALLRFCIAMAEC